MSSFLIATAVFALLGSHVARGTSFRVVKSYKLGSQSLTRKSRIAQVPSNASTTASTPTIATTLLSTITPPPQTITRTISGSSISIDKPSTYTVYFTVSDWGGTEYYQVIDGPTYSTLTLVGPTSTTLTVTESGLPWNGQYLPSLYVPQSTDRCHWNQTGPYTIDFRTALIESTLVLKDGEAFTFFGNTDVKTYTGPVSEVITSTYLNYYPDSPGDQFEPGMSCEELCGYCRLFFPSVSVFYWPVTDANTACLTSGNSTPTSTNFHDPRVTARRRSPQDGGSGPVTIVNEAGFTLQVLYDPKAPKYLLTYQTAPHHQPMSVSHSSAHTTNVVLSAASTPQSHSPTLQKNYPPPSSLTNPEPR